MTGRCSTVFARSLGGVMLALVAFISVATAQFDGFQDLAGLKSGGEDPKAEFTITLTPATAKPGDEVTLTVKVKLTEGYYIYGTMGDFVGRTIIETTETGLESIDQAFIPDRNEKSVFIPEFKAEVTKFHDQVIWKRRYRILKNADPARVTIKGELNGQYCSEGAGGKCVQINPAHEFQVALANAVDVSAPRFEYEERPNRGKKSPALLQFKLSPEDAKHGDKVTLSITMELDKGWHTFSLTQKGDGGDPTVIEFDALQGLKPVGADFQADHPPEIETPLPDLRLEVHNERVTWTRELEVLAGVAPGKYGLKGTISYQNCERSCLPTHDVSFSLGDVSAASSVARQTPTETDVAAPPAKTPQDEGLFAFLLTAIGFGLVSLLTPCVFPMVPITVSFFLKQSESEHHRPLAVAFVFCGSIVATFTILGVGIAAIFGAAQLNDLATNPWLNVAIGTMFFVFAFNMLGLFEIRIPSSLLTFTANKEQAGGYLGAMFMALTFTLTSFTCTFAFAGTLLVAASQGQYYWPIIGMLAFGAAFASPFFLLAMAPSLLKKLPKSGGWMNVVKVVMGLIEIGAAVKFYSVADLMWNPEPMVFDYVFVMIAWLVLSLTIALYLLGVFRLSHDVSTSGISVGRLVLVMAFMGLSGNLAVGLITHQRGGGWFMDQIIAFAPPRFEKDSAAHIGGAAASDLPEPSNSHHGLRFILDVDKGIEYATKSNRPLLFDFTGQACTNCRLMEIKMAEPHIHSRLEKLVLVQLYMDRTPMIADRKEVQRLKKRNIDLEIKLFGSVTMPAYAVMTPDGKTVLSSYSGLERSDGEFAAFLDEGWKKWEARGGK